MPGFLFAATLLSATLSLPLSKLSGLQVGALVLVSVAGAALSHYTSTAWLSGGFIFAGAVITGAAVGRAIPARPGPMALFLAVISTLDVLWIWFGTGSGTQLGPYANFSLEFGSGLSSIGSADLIVASAITTHWRRRKASIPVSLAPAPMGMIGSNVFALVTGVTNLALLPFITAGWIITQFCYRPGWAGS